MLFNSLQFCIFFPVVTILYFLLPHRYRWSLLLAASCVFYMAFIPAYILVLFLLIAIDYFAAIFIEDSEPGKRKRFLVISILATCITLFVFKYFNFFNTNMARLAVALHWNYSIQALNIILPIGLSFHTFQSLSYVIEVYRGNQKAERRFGIYSLYVMFYPQLVAGPIERPGSLLYQFYDEHKFEYRRVTDGLKLMAWGMFKKIVIADRLALFVNQVYDKPQGYDGMSLIIATVFFAFQIYCDFSGYSDIAIGAAQVMGFRLMDNFNRPYFSKSVGEFWRRWHISLASWFRDYIYIPLGGNRVAVSRWYINVLVTFLISGLWHGANWTFIIWGCLNGFYIISGIITYGIRRKIVEKTGLAGHPYLHRHLKVLSTFVLVTFAWIFFRASSVRDASYIITHLFDGIAGNIGHLLKCPMTAGKECLAPILAGQSFETFLIAVFSIVFMEAVHLIQRHGSIRHMLSERPAYVRWALYYVFILGMIVFGEFGRNQFIYFQF